jgi:fructose-1,6-bisphosphatase/sedoheptulose 1,7-bisphosphatase-like protein
VFVLTGITDGVLVRGVREFEEHLEIQSFILDSKLGEAFVAEMKVPRY